mgnify:CR=1 FL=1
MIMLRLVTCFYFLLVSCISLFAQVPTALSSKNIFDYLSQQSETFVRFRQYLHAHPELSNHEYATAQFITEKLKSFGYTNIKPGVGGTGVVASLHTGKPGKVVALRADMDALPLHESSQLSYRSIHDNRMHACGHDGHMATLLLAAQAAQAFKSDLKGTIKFIFQPAEEAGKGAESMIRAGVLVNPRVDAIFGLHAWPNEKVSSISTRVGAQMAGSVDFDIEIKGSGGHVAMPQHTVNPIFVAARLLSAFEHLVQQKDPTELMVLNIASIHSGSSYNVVEDDCQIKGTLRVTSPKLQRETLAKMRSIIKHTCSAYGCKASLREHMYYPPTVNTAKETALVLDVAREIYQDSSMVFARENPVLPAEDFSLYLEKVPGCFFFLGQGLSKSALHTSTFDFNDKSLVTGAYVLLRSAIRVLYD